MSQQNQAPGNNASQNRPAGPGGNPPPRGADTGSGAADAGGPTIGTMPAPTPSSVPANRLAPATTPRQETWINYYYLAEGEEEEFDHWAKNALGQDIKVYRKRPWKEIYARGEEAFINDDGTATLTNGYLQDIPFGSGIPGHYDRPPRQ